MLSRTLVVSVVVGALLALIALAVMALLAPNPADAPLWAMSLGVIA